MNPGMFREYDIRGIAGKDMTEDDVVLILPTHIGFVC